MDQAWRAPWRNSGGGGKTTLISVVLLGKMVEAAGVEPASERPVATEIYMHSRS
jgi:hypothetical protein